MIFPALFYKCSRNLGAQLQQAIIAPVSKPKSWIPGKGTCIVVCILALLLLAFYVYKKAPYMVRLSGTICILSWFAKSPSLCESIKHLLRDNISGGNWLSIDWFCTTLQQNFVTINSVFFTLVFIRFWWCLKVNIVRNEVNARSDFLIAQAKHRNAPRREKKNGSTVSEGTTNIPVGFPNGWIPLLESRDLKIAQVVPIYALGEAFVVFRGTSGRAFVLDAYCPHLGANLGVGGQVKENCLECPFHSWRFRGEDAKCVDIPYSDKNNIPTQANGKTWPSEEKNGFIYVWYHAEGKAPSWHIPVIPEINDGTWSYRGRTEHKVFCHIQEIPENGADAAHLQPVHSETTFAGTNPGKFRRKWKFLDHKWDASWEQCPEPDSHIANLSLSHYMRLFNIYIPLTNAKFDIQQIGPATVHLRLNSSFGKGVFIQSIVPEEALQHRLIHQLYTEFTFPQWVSSTYLRMEDTMVQRDILMWNNKRFLKSPVLVKEDRNINKFRRWYKQFYSTNGPTHQEFKEKTEPYDF